DVIGANRNGIRAVGVTYGYGTPQELTEAGASHLCASPRAVLDHIHSSFG
ncbi:MAG TPA: HAD family hydrolase, partial [Bradyrhizobium sp.]|nr:HAD family hydrolase [Bradyrhizobium sp.]